jgi:hypothetical protein
LATKVYETYEIELQNGTVVTLRPLPIAQLREFMTHMAKLDGSLNENEAVVALKTSAPELAANKGELENALDMPTIMKIVEVCGGIKMDDPNLLAAALLAGQN